MYALQEEDFWDSRLVYSWGTFEIYIQRVVDIFKRPAIYGLTNNSSVRIHCGTII